MGTYTWKAALREWHSLDEESHSNGRGGCDTHSGANHIGQLVHGTVESTSQAEKGISKEWGKG
jgi:hypothetical protein